MVREQSEVLVAVGAESTSTARVGETDCVRGAGLPSGDDVLLGHRFAGDRKPLFPLAWASWSRVLDEWRNRSRRPRRVRLGPGADVKGGDTQDEALAGLGLGEIERLLERLTAEQRDVVLLRVLAGLPLEQVAEVLGRSTGAVKALQRRALNALNKLIGEPPVSEPSRRAIWGMR